LQFLKGLIMKLHLSLLVVPALTLALVGCNTPPTQEQSGMVVGGILGGAIGNQVGRGSGRTVATILGTIVGASIGGNVGRSMDDTDRIKTAHALESVRTSVPSTWVNPDTRNQYTVTPIRTYESAAGPCREYTMRALIGGQPETVYGTACRQADGSWKVVN
jgi:surface antigen